MAAPDKRKPVVVATTGSQNSGNAGSKSKEDDTSGKWQQQARWRERNPEKVWCHAAFQSALRRGLIEKQPCRVCGDADAEGHHPDYSRPAVVEWYCRKHHKAEHMRLKAGGDG